MFFSRVDIFLKYFLISSVCIITTIGYFLSSADSYVDFYVFKTFVGHFKLLTIPMMYWGFWNSLRMYCFSFSLNLLYWSLNSLCSDVFPKTTPKSSTYPLKLQIDDMYTGWSNHLPRLLRPWWPPLLTRTPWPCHCPLLLELDSLVSEARVILASLPSLPLLTASGEAVSVSKFIVVYSSFLNTFKIILVSLFRVGHNPTHS